MRRPSTPHRESRGAEEKRDASDQVRGQTLDRKEPSVHSP